MLFARERGQRSLAAKIVQAVASAFACALLAGCGPRPRFTDFVDLSSDNRAQATIVSFDHSGPGGELLPKRVWLDANRFVVLRYVGDGDGRLDADIRLEAFDIREEALYDLAGHSINELCGGDSRTGAYNFSLLPDGNLAFVLDCDYVTPSSKENSSYSMGRDATELHVWNSSTREFEWLFDFSYGIHERGFSVSQFTHSPDMTEFVYSFGGFFSGGMILVQDIERIYRLVPDFYLARSPTWSPDGSTIAFAGVQTSIPTPPAKIPNFSQQATLAHQPKDLYLLDVAVNEPFILVQNIQSIGTISWLPQSNRCLSFTGNLGNVEGIWLIDIQGGGFTRIWDKHSSHAWAPDGKFLVIDVLEWTENWHLKLQTNVIVSPRLSPSADENVFARCGSELAGHPAPKP